jgi:hypothetical protein
VSKLPGINRASQVSRASFDSAVGDLFDFHALLTGLLTGKVYCRSTDLDQEIRAFRYDSLIDFDDPCAICKRHFVSNAVSSAETFEHSTTNLGGQKVLRCDEIWTSESTGEQEIWA